MDPPAKPEDDNGESMTGLTFRRATRADLEAIVDLLLDDPLGAAREDGSRPLNPRYIAGFEAVDRDPNQYLAVVEDGGRIIGSLQITFIPSVSRLGMWRGQIEAVRITRTRRGEGLGRQMFDWAIAECRQRGCELVQLTMDKTRTESFKFYEALGFRASHEGFKLSL
ncbi:L-amino acid N-acyltransferase YncA [Dongia mobilis]|uniref:L-amino acid N-acyltransferase YncA n=1 Tax=Dongia mobilis TaxID=578943 RepID=A0A4V3DDX7_9PROT|nr:GNAT family N-acetyltransferase [Dongia mobilis]TDQ78561.1 L-amino acid N-acyltransferase YncA [Dongia mobilis]